MTTILLAEDLAVREARLLMLGELDATGLGGLETSLQAAAVSGASTMSIQSSLRVRGSARVQRSDFPESVVRPQLRACIEAQPDAATLALVGPERLYRLVAEALQDIAGPIVFDMHAVDRDGNVVVSNDSVDVMRRHLTRECDLAVANVHELEVLTKRGADDLSGMKDGCRSLHDLGASHVLVTGGRLEGHAVDVLFDGFGFIEFGTDRIRAPRTLRGAGATLIGGIGAHLARGAGLFEAIDLAKKLVVVGINAARETPWGPVCNPMAQAWDALDIDPRPITPEAAEQAAFSQS